MPPRSRVPRGTPASGAPLGRAGKGPRGRDRCTGEPIRLVTPRVYFSGIFAPYLVSCRESQSGLTVRDQRGSLPFSRLGDEGYFPKSFVNGDLFFPVFRSVLVEAAVMGSVLSGTGPCSPRPGFALSILDGSPRDTASIGHSEPVNPAERGDHTAATGSEVRPCRAQGVQHQRGQRKKITPRNREIKYLKG